MAHQSRIKPTTAAFAPGDHAKFMTPFAQALAIRIVKFGRERAFAHPRGVGFYNPKHKIDGPWAHARSRGRLPRDHIRGCHEGIGAEIHIQKAALRALE